MQVSTYVRTAFVLCVAVLALAPAATAAPQAPTMSQNEQALFLAVNRVRAANGLRTLRVDPTLQRVARSYSTRILRTGSFAHGAMGARLAQAGARGPVFGENLAWGSGSRGSATSIVRGWMTSPSHRANLLRPGWSRIGIGALRGTFQGRAGTTVVTANFAGS